ncbi:MAG: PhnD/SsuA/transferrin family substrate-binding protein [Gammaproteobacteria bacterium]|nr:PhnD/SsuA/transferrin family substrate-binding protein [Gammaproteobacteria bacterium]
MTRFIATLLLLFISSTASIQGMSADSESVTLTVNHDDGGKVTKRHMHDLLDALNEGGCHAISSATITNTPVQLLFDSRPASIVKKQMPDYQFIARAKTLYGELNVRGAILIQASRGITELSLLKGEWIGFVNKESWSGYLLPVKLLQEVGIDESSNTFHFIGNHVGPVSGLLHRDVTIAVIAEPLAQRWAEKNGLSIVATTNAVETGGWWMHRSVSEKLTQNCTQSLIKLHRARHKALPAWIDGFVIPK